MVKGETTATGKQHEVFFTKRDKNSEGYPTGAWRNCWNLLTSRTHNGGGCGFETAYSKTTIWASKSTVVFVQISQWFCENQSAILVKSECDFGKVGVWFCENQPVILWKSECAFGKVGVCFWQSRSVILEKSECDFVKISLWCCENQPVILWKSECDFGKVGVWFWIDKIFTKYYTINLATYITLYNTYFFSFYLGLYYIS